MMGLSPHFICLSMIVSGRAWAEHPHFSAVDGLAYAIERENDPSGPLPPLVERSVAIFTRSMNGDKEG